MNNYEWFEAAVSVPEIYLKTGKLWPGMGGRFAPEQVATLFRNGWQVWSGIYTSIKDPRICVLIFGVFLFPGIWFISPSLIKNETRISLKKANKYINKGNLGRAIVELETILESNPENIEANKILHEINKKGYGSNK